MRQIETQMNMAIRSLLNGGSTNWAGSNTTVTKNPNNGNVTVLLHGNHIATLNNDFVAIYDGGWQSNTTKSRLNALLVSSDHIQEFFKRITSGLYLMQVKLSILLVGHWSKPTISLYLVPY